MHGIKSAIVQNLAHLAVDDPSSKLTIEMYDTFESFQSRVQTSVHKEVLYKATDAQFQADPTKVPCRFIDHITQKIMKCPMKVHLESGGCESYSQHSISGWIANCRSRSVPPTSPKTGDLILEPLQLERDCKLEEEIEAYMTKARDGIQDLPHESQVSATSIQELGDLVAMLDSMQPVVSKVITDWAPPHLIVLGSESSGKSTLLERLLKIPIFPRAPSLCTRMPICVKVRRGGPEAEVTLKVLKSDSETVVEGPTTLAMGSSEEAVRKIMNKYSESAIELDTELHILVISPILPPINMIDLPGIVVMPRETARRTKALARKYIRRHKAESIFLLVEHACTSPNQSAAYLMMVEEAIESRCIGVLTKIDKLKEVDADLHKRFQGSDTHKLEPHGFIGTANPPITLQEDESQMVRLYRQSRCEVAQLEKLGLPGHGVGKILSVIRQLYRGNMVDSMIPDTIACLVARQEEIRLENAQLGQPVPSSDQPDLLRGPVFARLSNLLNPFFAAQAQQMKTEHLHSFQTRLERILLQKRDEEVIGQIRCHLAPLRSDLLKVCQGGALDLYTCWAAHLHNLLLDDDQPLRLQRFPSVLKAVHDKLCERLRSICTQGSSQMEDLQRYVDVAFGRALLDPYDHLCIISATSPLMVYSVEGLNLMASYLASLVYSHISVSPDDFRTIIREAVMTSPMDEACHSLRCELADQDAEINTALQHIMDVLGGANTSTMTGGSRNHICKKLAEAGCSVHQLNYIFTPDELLDAGYTFALTYRNQL